MLRAPGAFRVLATSLVGRLPLGVVPLALLLFARGNGATLATAGGLVGVYVAGTAIGAPVLARAVDRYRQPPVLLGSTALSTVGFLLLVVGGSASLPVAVLGVALAGLGAPPLEACLRALWPDLLSQRLVHAGYALDVAAQELIFVTGPLITLASVAAAGSAAGLVAALATILLGRVVPWPAPGGGPAPPRADRRSGMVDPHTMQAGRPPRDPGFGRPGGRWPSRAGHRPPRVG